MPGCICSAGFVLVINGIYIGLPLAVGFESYEGTWRLY